MWGFASDAIFGNARRKNEILKPNRALSDCSDDEIFAEKNREEGLECQICRESFNIVENVPYVLWCGHTICKNCISGLKWTILKLPALPVQLPFLISCPWCSCLSFRLVYKGKIKFPRRNYFLLWMVENMNGNRVISHFSLCNDQPVFATNKSVTVNQANNVKSACALAPTFCYPETERFHSSFRESLVFFFHLTAKFPLIFILLLTVLYVIPVSATILVLYILITVLFVVPALLVLYFACPFLCWLGREIIN